MYKVETELNNKFRAYFCEEYSISVSTNNIVISLYHSDEDLEPFTELVVPANTFVEIRKCE